MSKFQVANGVTIDKYRHLSDKPAVSVRDLKSLLAPVGKSWCKIIACVGDFDTRAASLWTKSYGFPSHDLSFIAKPKEDTTTIHAEVMYDIFDDCVAGKLWCRYGDDFRPIVKIELQGRANIGDYMLILHVEKVRMSFGYSGDIIESREV